MKIEITENLSFEIAGKYTADCVDLPGSPPIAYGNTEEAAIINLLHTLLARTNEIYNSPIEIIYK